jgi:hypothetical protein
MAKEMKIKARELELGDWFGGARVISMRKNEGEPVIYFTTGRRDGTGTKDHKVPVDMEMLVMRIGERSFWSWLLTRI